MHVKIDTATHVEGQRVEAGSVIEIAAEIFELNQGWMKATDEPINLIIASDDARAAAADDKPAKKGDK